MRSVKLAKKPIFRGDYDDQYKKEIIERGAKFMKTPPSVIVGGFEGISRYCCFCRTMYGPGCLLLIGKKGWKCLGRYFQWHVRTINERYRSLTQVFSPTEKINEQNVGSKSIFFMSAVV